MLNTDYFGIEDLMAQAIEDAVYTQCLEARYERLSDTPFVAVRGDSQGDVSGMQNLS